MFVGRYDQNMDAKGRVNIPSKFRSSLGETFIVATGDGKYATIYPMDEWKAFMERALSEVEPDERPDFVRYIQNFATECDLDSQGRVCIPPKVRVKVELTKEVVVVGAHNKIEVWSLDGWNEYHTNEIEPDEAKFKNILKRCSF